MSKLSKFFGKQSEIVFEVKPATQEEPGQWFPSRFVAGPNEYRESDKHHAVVEVTAHDMSGHKRQTKRVVDKTPHGDPKKARAQAQKAARELATKAGRSGYGVILNDGADCISRDPITERPSLEPSQSDVNKDVLLFAGVFGVACIIISGAIYMLAVLQG
jgi:hypothetical protein